MPINKIDIEATRFLVVKKHLILKPSQIAITSTVDPPPGPIFIHLDHTTLITVRELTAVVGNIDPNRNSLLI